MKRKFISAVLSAAMLLSVAPVAFADADYTSLDWWKGNAINLAQGSTAYARVNNAIGEVTNVNDGDAETSDLVQFIGAASIGALELDLGSEKMIDGVALIKSTTHNVGLQEASIYGSTTRLDLRVNAIKSGGTLLATLSADNQAAAAITSGKYRYIYMVQDASDGVLQVKEFYAFQKADPTNADYVAATSANIAVGATATTRTAEGKGTAGADAGYALAATEAIDGDANTSIKLLTDASGLNGFLKVNLGESKNFNAISLKASVDRAATVNVYASNVNKERQNEMGTNTTLLGSQTLTAAGSVNITVTAAEPYQYIYVTIDKAAWLTVSELEVLAQQDKFEVSGDKATILVGYDEAVNGTTYIVFYTDDVPTKIVEQAAVEAVLVPAVVSGISGCDKAKIFVWNDKMLAQADEKEFILN